MSDQEQWDPKARTLAQTIYAVVVGTFLLVSGVYFLPDVFRDDEVSFNELILIGGIIVGGLVVAIPSITMPIIHKGVRSYLEWKKGSKDA